MKQAILIHKNVYSRFNIGDYIQGIAASQFFPQKEFLYLDREELDEYDGEEAAIIMNGWFMFSKNWPPSDRLHPLFVAFHINSSALDTMLSAKSIEYLKRHEPIGCRDVSTCELLLKKGVNAYFSGCLTLTLGQSYHNNGTNDDVLIVDPIIELNKNFISISKYIYTWFKYRLIINKIYRKRGYYSIKDYIKTIVFFQQYSKIFSKGLLENAEYPSVYVKNTFKNEGEKMDCAREYLNMYSRAKLVITSKIHCQMPCLALGTPSIFIKNKNDVESSTCRFGGLIDLYNILLYNKGEFSSNDLDLTCIIDSNTKVINKSEYKFIAEPLISTCKNFIKSVF